MERLTDEIGLKACDNCKKCEHLCDLAEKAIERLKLYEAAEENGLLVRLPCRVGDFLFAPTRDFVSIFQVIGFEYSGYDVFVRWKLCKGITGRFQIDGIYKSEIGKTVFRTKAEAEAKLKEMEGENEKM